MDCKATYVEHHIFMQQWTLFIRKLQCQREEINEQNHYAVVIVKRTAECTENQRMHGPMAACSLFLQWSGNIDCTITGARCYSSNLPQGGALYIVLFMVIQS